jgi:retron-type reverse transcriptase
LIPQEEQHHLMMYLLPLNTHSTVYDSDRAIFISLAKEQLSRHHKFFYALMMSINFHDKMASMNLYSQWKNEFIFECLRRAEIPRHGKMGTGSARHIARSLDLTF